MYAVITNPSLLNNLIATVKYFTTNSSNFYNLNLQLIYMKILVIAVIALLFVSLALAQPNKTENKTQERGKGLDEAIKHVPDFVAEKLNYMRELFSNSTKGIGQALSDWIHSFFKPVFKSNETENKTK